MIHDRSRFRRLRAALMFGVAAVCLSQFVGCDSGKLATHPVQGTIRFEDGTWPMFGDVEFYSVDHKLNARGKINKDGSFTVGTYEENDGAVEGLHQVMVMQLTGNYLTEKLNDRIKHDHGELIAPSFFDYRSSGLECTISPGENKVELLVRKNPRQTDEGMPAN